MGKVTYNGPGDAITIDGITVDKGKSVELTNAQIVRLREDPTNDLTVEDAPESHEDRDRILEEHAAQREKAAADAAAAPKTRGAKRAGKGS